MSIEVANLNEHLVALLNATELAEITADKKTDSALAIAFSQADYSTIESLLQQDTKTLLDDLSTYKDGADTKDVPKRIVSDVIKMKFWMIYLKQ